MRVVKPHAEILPELRPLEKIELCGRVCYKSEDKIEEGSARPFAERILSRGHTSVFEHTRVIMPLDKYRDLRDMGGIQTNPATDRLEFYYSPYGAAVDIELNGRDFVNHVSRNLDLLESLPTAEDYMTVRFICSRAISQQMQRHRVFSFSELSLRYVKYDGDVDFIQPAPYDWADYHDTDGLGDAAADPRWQAWYFACEHAEEAYHTMLKEGCSPQEARNVLPLCTKSDLVVTARYKEWQEFLKLRLPPGADPQMRYLLRQLVELENFPKEEIGHLEDDEFICSGALHG